MKIVVAGLGYVGSVTAGCLTHLGHEVCGVDPADEKVSAVRQGRAPVHEPRLDNMFASAVRCSRLTATGRMEDAITGAGVVLICVGTPSAPDGTMSVAVVERVARHLGEVLSLPGLRQTFPDGRLAIVVRSTMVPSSSHDVVLPSLLAGIGVESLPAWLGYAVQPEYLREGSAVADFLDPPKTVIGTDQRWVADRLLALYEGIPGSNFVLSVREAELSKFADNTFHALKVAFANEMGRVAGASGLNVHEVLRPFLADRRLNLSEKYLRPGPPFGGSCLPKDLRAIIARARVQGVPVPLLESVLASNDVQRALMIRRVLETAGVRFVVLGVAFKVYTDDVRESPFVDLVRALLDAGRPVVAYDASIAHRELLGANRDAFSSLRSTSYDQFEWAVEAPVVETGDVVVLCTDHPDHVAVAGEAAEEGYPVLDLSGWHGNLERSRSRSSANNKVVME